MQELVQRQGLGPLQIGKQADSPEAEKGGDFVSGANLSRIFDGGLADTEISAGDLEIDVS